MIFGLTVVQLVAYVLIAIGIVLYVVDLIRYKKLGLGFLEPSFLVPFIIGSVCCLAGVVMTWLVFFDVI